MITWASRTRLRLASSLAAAAALRHAPLKVLRVGVHPPDIHHPALVRSIEETADRIVEQRKRTVETGTVRALTEPAHTPRAVGVQMNLCSCN